LVLIIVVLFTSWVAAHELPDNELLDDGVKLKTQVMSVIMITSILVTALVILAIISKRKTHNHKRMLFCLMIIPIIAATLYAAGTTIYLNQVSLSKGPVHWHADFEIWNCGQKLNLVDPQGLSNRVGTPVFHDHNDFRIHLEGVVMDQKDITLENFFRVVGGSLAEEEAVVPTNAGSVVVHDGDLCQGQPGKVQVFVYKIANPDERGNWKYTQEKIENYPEYVLSPYSNVPPGDCIIIEFDQEKEKTEKICTSYKAAIKKGEAHGG